MIFLECAVESMMCVCMEKWIKCRRVNCNFVTYQVFGLVISLWMGNYRPIWFLMNYLENRIIRDKALWWTLVLFNFFFLLIFYCLSPTRYVCDGYFVCMWGCVEKVWLCKKKNCSMFLNIVFLMPLWTWSWVSYFSIFRYTK